MSIRSGVVVCGGFSPEVLLHSAPFVGEHAVSILTTSFLISFKESFCRRIFFVYEQLGKKIHIKLLSIC